MHLGTAMRAIRDQVFQAAGLNALARRRLDGTRAAILMYHRVLPESEARRLSVHPAMSVTPESFDLQLTALRAIGFEPLHLHELCERLAKGRPWPKRALAITFDDGWLDNHVHARPILVRHGWPATVFVVTDRVGTHGAFWPEEVTRRLVSRPPEEVSELVSELLGHPIDTTAPRHALLDALMSSPPEAREALLDRLRAATPAPRAEARELMDWEELEAWSRDGVDVESHGCTHALFDVLSDHDLERELRASLDTLRVHGHGRHRLLAYPSGAFDARVMAAARDAGYAAAVTTDHRVARHDDDRLALPRLGVHEAVGRDRTRFLSKIPGWR